jgi:hypothetical protein
LLLNERASDCMSIEVDNTSFAAEVCETS